MIPHLSDSQVQRNIETSLYVKLKEQFNLPELHHKRIEFGSAEMEFDGYAETGEDIWLFEVSARITPPLPAQKKKVMTDILKMHAWKLKKEQEGEKRPVKAFMVFVADETGECPMKRYFTGQSWQAEVIRVFGIGVEAIALDKQSADLLKQAQKDQAQGMTN